MGRSAVEKLSEEDRAKVEGWLREFLDGRLSMDGVKALVDEHLALRLGAEVPSRSALHRHSQKFAALGDRLRETRAVTEMLVAEAGPSVADGKGFKVLVQAFESMAFNTLAQMDADEAVDFEELMQFGRAIASVAAANKTDTDRALKLKAEFAKEASKKLETAVTAGDLERDAMIRAKRIMGFE